VITSFRYTPLLSTQQWQFLAPDRPCAQHVQSTPRFKAFKKRVPSKSFVGKRPQLASASKDTSSVLSELSGLENVLLNDFVDDVLDSEDVSEQRASASLPDSVPIESEEERVLHVNKIRLLSMLSGIMKRRL
jgi:hypothetical protein